MSEESKPKRPAALRDDLLTPELAKTNRGIAKRDDDDGAVPEEAVDMGPSSLRTTEGRRIGTPRYMAPEQHAGDATHPPTDQYAWGLVAFEPRKEHRFLSMAPIIAALEAKSAPRSERGRGLRRRHRLGPRGRRRARHTRSKRTGCTSCSSTGASLASAMF